MANDNLEITVKVNTSDSEKKLKDVEKNLENVASAGERGSEGVNNFGNSLIVLNQTLELGKKAFEAFKTVVDFTLKSLDSAYVSENITKGFVNLQQTIGLDSVQSINKLKTATQGLISETDLMRAANKAVIAGVEDGSGKFVDMAKSAVILGRAMGVDAKSAVDLFTQGVSKQSAEMLIGLGIVIDKQKAETVYAQSVGKTVAELTSLEKKQIFINEINKIAVEQSQKLAQGQGTAGEAYQKVKVDIDN